MGFPRCEGSRPHLGRHQGVTEHKVGTEARRNIVPPSPDDKRAFWYSSAASWHPSGLTIPAFGGVQSPGFYGPLGKRTILGTD